MARSKVLSELQWRRLFPSRQQRELVEAIDHSKLKIPGYHADYALWSKSNDLLHRVSQACFGSLRDCVYAKRSDVRYLTYIVKVPIKYDDQLSLEQKLEWVRLGQVIGLLPTDQTPEKMLSGEGIKIDLEAPETLVARLYMQLCWIRWIRESPGVVYHSLRLVHELGCDPWAAVAYTHKHHTGYLDQTLLPYAGAYVEGDNRKDCERDLAFVVQLHRLTHVPEQVDDRHFLTTVREGKAAFWQWHAKTIHPPKHFVLAHRAMLLSPEVYPVIARGNFDAAEKTVGYLKRGKSNVAFEFTSPGC